MAGLPTYIDSGFGARNFKSYAFVPAIRVGDIIHLSGQGGYSQQPPYNFVLDIEEQIDNAFANVDMLLKLPGGQGWSQVYRIRSYHMPLNTQAMNAMVRNFRKWMPDHKATWTCVQVGRLGDDDMRVEIEVEAYDPQGAAAASKTMQ